MADRAEPLTAGEAERTLVMERVFRANVERVFRAWTDPAFMVRWWGPEGFTTPELTLDVRPGGTWRTVMRSPDGSSHSVSGVFRAIDPPHRLVLSWAWEEADGTRGHETEIELTFATVETGTRMRLVQRLFQSPDWRDRHRHGWTQSLDKLDRYFG